MKKDNDRMIYGYEKFKETVGVSLDVFEKELKEKSRELGAPDFSSMIQVHGNQIVEAAPGMIHPSTDGLFTDQPGVILYGCFADCLPIYLWDEKLPLVGLAHAGWKGTTGRIAQRLAEEMKNAGAKNLRAWIGPGICAKHYQVSPDFDVVAKPLSTKTFFQRNEDYFYDLYEENRVQLEELLLPEHIQVTDICTFEDSNYYSYRRDQQTRGRNLAYIMLK